MSQARRPGIATRSRRLWCDCGALEPRSASSGRALPTDILFGASCCLALDDELARYLLSCWRAGRSSLVLPPSASPRGRRERRDRERGTRSAREIRRKTARWLTCRPAERDRSATCRDGLPIRGGNDEPAAQDERAVRVRGYHRTALRVVPFGRSLSFRPFRPICPRLLHGRPRRRPTCQLYTKPRVPASGRRASSLSGSARSGARRSPRSGGRPRPASCSRPEILVTRRRRRRRR